MSSRRQPKNGAPPSTCGTASAACRGGEPGESSSASPNGRAPSRIFRKGAKEALRKHRRLLPSICSPDVDFKKPECNLAGENGSAALRCVQLTYISAPLPTPAAQLLLFSLDLWLFPVLSQRLKSQKKAHRQQFPGGEERLAAPTKTLHSSVIPSGAERFAGRHLETLSKQIREGCSGTGGSRTKAALALRKRRAPVLPPAPRSNACSILQLAAETQGRPAWKIVARSHAEQPKQPCSSAGGCRVPAGDGDALTQ